MSTPLPRRTALRSAAAAAVVLAAGPLAACSVVEGATDGKPGDAAEGQEGAGSPVTLRGAGAVGAVDPAGAGLDEVTAAATRALLERAPTTGEAVARVYTWARPTLSLGRHQTAAGCYDLARAAELVALVPGSAVVDARRSTSVLYLHLLDIERQGAIERQRQHVLEVEERVVRAFGSDEEIARLQQAKEPTS